MSKVLIISKVFYPNISPRANRTTQLALEFVRLGNEVTVMLPSFDAEFYREYSEKTGIIFKSMGRLKYKRFEGDSKIVRIAARLVQLLVEFPEIQLVRLIGESLKNESSYDMIVSIAVPHPIHWGVAKAIRRNRKLCKVWAADCGDPYMGCKTDTFEKLFYFKYVEKKWCKLADYIIIPDKSAQSAYYSEFHNKIKVIPQGFNLSEIEIPVYSENKVPTFAYAGGLALHFRNPYPLLEFLCTLDIDFKFIVYNESALLEPFKEKLKNKLEVRSYIPREQLLPILGQMDFLINFENNTAVQVPSKLIDYSIVNRPVISISNNFDKAGLTKFLKRDYSDQYILPDVSTYDIKQVATKFLNLIEL